MEGGGDGSAVDPEGLLEWVATVSLDMELVRTRAYVAEVNDGEFARVNPTVSALEPATGVSMDGLAGHKAVSWYESAMFPMLSTASAASLA